MIAVEQIEKWIYLSRIESRIQIANFEHWIKNSIIVENRNNKHWIPEFENKDEREYNSEKWGGIVTKEHESEVWVSEIPNKNWDNARLGVFTFYFICFCSVFIKY